MVFNPFNVEDVERQDVLGFGHIQVPPTILQADNTIVTERSNTVTNIDIKVGRKLLRNSQMLFLWLASTDEAAPGTDNAFQAIVTCRTLMKFG